MAVIAINDLTYHIGDRPLYQNASLHIKPKDKIGLIGLNGTGKSTLLRLIDGSYQSAAGTISKSAQCTIGFLDQDLLSYSSPRSILEVAMQAFEEACKVQDQISKVLKEMEINYRDSLVEKLSALQETFDRLEGYSMQAKAEEVLEGIGFQTSDLTRPLKEFSGGWRMRVMLAKLLLEKPDLLMLDEPTNHLDLPSIKWVEQYLKNYEGAVVVVSHDRRFLDQVAQIIVEVDQQKLVAYPGNYQQYLEQKALRAEVQNNAYQNQQQKIKQSEQFINRFRAKSTKARQVQSRIKSLEKMERVEEVLESMAPVNFKFDFKQKSGRVVSTIKDVTKSYDELIIFDKASALVERGDKIALIGANGKGKSTLLRVVAQQESIQGESQLGYNVNMAFYAQHQLEALNLNHEILEELKLTGSGRTELELRNLLGCFLFTDDDVFKKIKVLSGGEKSRVALAKTLISEANFLLLDEPTNHLDMQSVQILIQALNQFKGSFIIVSHDRHFISKVANKIWYIQDRKLKSYPGTYKEYEYWVSRQTPVAAVQKKPAVAKTKPPKPAPDVRLRKKLQKKLASTEDQIHQSETAKQNLEQRLADPTVFNDPDALKQATEKFRSNEALLSQLNEEWETIAGQIDALTDS